MSKLLNPESVAAELGLSPQWIRRLLNTGKIEGQRLGKNWVITEAALASYKLLRKQEAALGGRSQPKKK